MKIYVAGAIGQGDTELAAFDHALIISGIANYNLIRLSSVIPPSSTVLEVEKVETKPGTWGDRLYVVYAEARSSTRGEEVWAGIGWVQDPTDGKGLFVEHEGNSEKAVRDDIEASLRNLMRSRNMAELPIGMKVVGGKCIDKPVCAFVVATYQVSDWHNRPEFF